jgi:uncharacterized Tic20 family protein
MTQPWSPEPTGPHDGGGPPGPDLTKHAAPPQSPGMPSPGYGPPPQGYGPPPQGYGPPQGYPPPGPQGYGPPPSPLVGPWSPLVGRPLTQDEKTWGLLAHLGGLFLGFVAPLVVMLVKGSESPYTRAQAVEALNFQITLAIAYLMAAISLIVLIGFLLLPLVVVGHLVFGILASVASGRGELYRYPLTLRLVS